ncbi:MAG: glycosyltransferase, partial [Acidimicrobiales bacterium]
VELKSRHPDLEAVIVGEGYEREALEARIASQAAEDWIKLPGHLSDTDLVSLYRRAWVLASASVREGWGMTITEAGACGTPCVATRIAGHLDAVEPGRSGLLAASPQQLTGQLDAVLSDADLRARLGSGAVERSGRLTWEATARGTLEALAAEAVRHRR